MMMNQCERGAAFQDSFPIRCRLQDDEATEGGRCKSTYLSFGRMGATLELDRPVGICGVLPRVLVRRPHVHRRADFQA